MSKTDIRNTDLRTVKKPLIIITITLSLLITTFFLLGPRLKPKPTVLQPTPELIASVPALTYAHQQFLARGGTYIWGPNDCSVFVTDYLKAQGAPIKQRLTTAQLIQKSEMAKLGFYQSLTPPKPGDVIVYRYQSQQTNRPSGHCGVILQHNQELWVAHNAMSFKGLVIQKLSEFNTTALNLGANQTDITIFTPKAN